MRIAICNIKKEEFNRIKKVIYLYAEKGRIDLVVEQYEKPWEILVSDRTFAMIFLSCGGLDSTAWKSIKKIKEVNDDCAITLLSPDKCLPVDAFEINPFKFMNEPVSENELATVIGEYFNTLNNKVLRIKSWADNFYVKTKDIIFIEAENKQCYIHLKNQTIKYNRTMAKTIESLPKNRFFKVNRSYVVNGDYIGGYNSQYVFLESGERIRLTRHYMPDFISDYLDYKTPLRLI